MGKFYCWKELWKIFIKNKKHERVLRINLKFQNKRKVGIYWLINNANDWWSIIS